MRADGRDMSRANIDGLDCRPTDIIEYQSYFGLQLPSGRLSERSKRFDAKYGAFTISSILVYILIMLALLYVSAPLLYIAQLLL